MDTRIIALTGLLAATGGATASADSAATFGANPDLVAGAEALLHGLYEEGIAHTQAGLLDTFLTLEERAAALSNLCAGYLGLGKYDIAIVHCSASLELSPGWQAYSNRALAYLGKRMLRLARRDYTLGLTLNPHAEQLLKVKALVEEAGRRNGGRNAHDPIASFLRSAPVVSTPG